MSKLFAAGVRQEEDWLVHMYRRYLGFEGLLLIGVTLVALGVAVDGLILVRSLVDPSMPELLRLAAAGQTLLIIGANVAFGSVAVAIIDNGD
jgi:hypothetical protein